MSDTTGRELLAKYGPTLGDVIGNLERRLSAANARIAELEEILGLNCNHEWFRTGEMEYGSRRCINCGVMVTAPSQPSTLPE